MNSKNSFLKVFWKDNVHLYSIYLATSLYFSNSYGTCKVSMHQYLWKLMKQKWYWILCWCFLLTSGVYVLHMWYTGFSSAIMYYILKYLTLNNNTISALTFCNVFSISDGVRFLFEISLTRAPITYPRRRRNQ